ncbi:sperm-associated antigen 5 [Salarias fasciatus]|uniref:sperm-associated antigen 5 n=1 Tax=Salarias fasciatus TaxID=181472 RepID=UPI001176BC65|nr:sperm-associated antigen 5 [Salarias fasciatus]
MSLGSLSVAAGTPQSCGQENVSMFIKSLWRSASRPVLVDDSALEGEKSLLTPVNVHHAGLWAEHLESPIPRPLFNSTALADKPQPDPVTEPTEDLEEKLVAVPQSEEKKPVRDVPLFPEGPLQQQLRQMAEFLFLASGKMGPALASAAATTAPPVGATPVESHSVSVGTSPVKLVDQSLNTSGQFERKREFSVADSCTATEPLLWNLNPGSLECLPRQELEQRLMSSMIMVEALVQQLAAARSQQCVSAGCPPSDLRDKLVQTDHTELSQTTMYRGVYMEALRKIRELELDGRSLQNLMQQMQSMRINMNSLSSDTDAALSKMKEIGGIITEDHQSLVSHYGHMITLFEKSKETCMRLTQKVKEALQQRSDMQTQMEDAFTAKEAAFSAMDQLRTHCAAEISELEKSVGSQQELLVALKQIYPEQVSLNKACTETLRSASNLLSQTMDDQSSLINELITVKSLLQKAAPMLLMMNEKAAAALSERDECLCSRDQAIEEREQLQEELNETHSSLKSAKETIGELNLQLTILTTETGVLQQQLNEKEEETGQLGRKVTELSATVSSTLASYAFLEQALAAESTKLQQSWQDIKEAKERVNQLETSLDQSEQRVCELTQALAQSEEQLGQLQTLHQSQSAEMQQLRDHCTQLKGVQEMNEFLLMENEFAREQVLESEGKLRESLQGLRERNIQCEDLKEEVCQLQLENRSLHEELEAIRSGSRATQLELEEKLAHAATEITLLLHTLRGLTNDLHAALSNQKPELPKDKDSHPVNDPTSHQPTNSFVNSIMMALTVEKQDDAEMDSTAASESTEVPESQSKPLLSETSAFTRVAAITPRKGLNEVRAEEEKQSRVAALLSDLGSTVGELISTLKLVQERKDAELLELQRNICGLQVEHQAAVTRHEAEVSLLKHQLSHLNRLMERGNQALQQKAQDEKTLAQLVTDVEEAHEALTKYKAENNDLRKDRNDLHRALQQSNVESQFLREELRRAGGQPVNQTQFMEEKIQLLKEVERLKASLQEVEQARAKLLERAKRHQIIHQNNLQKTENELQILNHMINRIRETLLSLPEVVKNCEQLQQLLDYIG